MNYRQSRTLMLVLGGFGILAYAVGASTDSLGFMIAALVLLLGSILQAVVFYRCPHCGKSLMPYRNGIPKHCPECGEELGE